MLDSSSWKLVWPADPSPGMPTQVVRSLCVHRGSVAGALADPGWAGEARAAAGSRIAAQAAAVAAPMRRAIRELMCMPCSIPSRPPGREAGIRNLTAYDIRGTGLVAVRCASGYGSAHRLGMSTGSARVRLSPCGWLGEASTVP